MIITITITENKTAEEWDVDRFTVQSDYPVLEVTACEEDAAVNHIKGVALCVIGHHNPVPDVIEFKVVRNSG